MINAQASRREFSRFTYNNLENSPKFAYNLVAYCKIFKSYLKKILQANIVQQKKNF